MKKFLLFYSIVIISAELDPDDRTVNVAIETSFQFEPKDIENNAGIVSHIKTFIDTIYRSLETRPTAPPPPHSTTTPPPSTTIPPPSTETPPQPIFRENAATISLSHFLTDLGDTLLNLTDVSIQNVTRILEKQMNDHKADPKSTFHNIFINPMLQKYIKKTIRHWSNSDGKRLKKKLQKLIQSGNPELKNLANRLNFFYTQKDIKKFYKLTRKLHKYLRKNRNVSYLIKKWLDFSIFHRYTKLNETSKLKVTDNMRLLLDYFTGESTFRTDETHTSPGSKHTEDVYGSVGDDVHAHHKHSVLRRNMNYDHVSKTHSGKKRDRNEMEKRTKVEKRPKIDKGSKNILKLGNIELVLNNLNKVDEY